MEYAAAAAAAAEIVAAAAALTCHGARTHGAAAVFRVRGLCWTGTGLLLIVRASTVSQAGWPKQSWDTTHPWGRVSCAMRAAQNRDIEWHSFGVFHDPPGSALIRKDGSRVSTIGLCKGSRRSRTHSKVPRKRLRPEGRD